MLRWKLLGIINHNVIVIASGFCKSINFTLFELLPSIQYEMEISFFSYTLHSVVLVWNVQCRLMTSKFF